MKYSCMCGTDFQAMRPQWAVYAGKFSLTESQAGEVGGLTHLGNPLATLSDLKDDIPPPGDDDSDGDPRHMHHCPEARTGDEQRHRTKREVMAEVMAVSKAARAQKRMQNEDDENLLEDVDSRFAGIVEVRTSPVHCSVVLSPSCMNPCDNEGVSPQQRMIHNDPRCACKWLVWGCGLRLQLLPSISKLMRCSPETWRNFHSSCDQTGGVCRAQHSRYWREALGSPFLRQQTRPRKMAWQPSARRWRRTRCMTRCAGRPPQTPAHKQQSAR